MTFVKLRTKYSYLGIKWPLVTPVQQEIDPVKRKKNERKNKDSIVRKQKISKYTIAIQSFFRQRKSFLSFYSYSFYGSLLPDFDNFDYDQIA